MDRRPMRAGQAERRDQWGGGAGLARRRYRLAQEEAAAGGGAAIMSYSGEGRRRKMAAGAAPAGEPGRGRGLCRGPCRVSGVVVRPGTGRGRSSAG